MDIGDMNEMWDMFMSMGGADGFAGMMGGMGDGWGKGKGKGKGKMKGKIGFGGGFGDGFGDGFEGGFGGGKCKGKGKFGKGIDPKVAQAIEECLAEIEEREGFRSEGIPDNLRMMAEGELEGSGAFSPMMKGVFGSADAPKAAKPAPAASPAPMVGGGSIGSGGVPDVKRLQLTGGSMVADGYSPVSYGVEYSKEHSIFSEAHTILNDLLFAPGGKDLTWAVEYVNDSDANIHPEVYQAWMAAGGTENLPTIAKVKELNKWGVGFGGKKNAERAAKLALSIAIGLEAEHAAEVISRNPGFGRLLQQLGAAAGAAGGTPGFNPY